MQKKAVRIITLSGYRYHTAPLFTKCELLTLSEIYAFKIAVFMFKVHKNTVPDFFQDYFVANSSVHNYNTRQKNHLHIPRWRNDKMKNSIRVKGVYIWNFVSNHLTTSCDLNMFRRNLRKSILIDKSMLDALP